LGALLRLPSFRSVLFLVFGFFFLVLSAINPTEFCPSDGAGGGWCRPCAENAICAGGEFECVNGTARIGGLCHVTSLSLAELDRHHAELRHRIEICKTLATRADLISYASEGNVTEQDALAALQLHGDYAMWTAGDDALLVRCGSFDPFLLLGFDFVLFFLVSLARERYSAASRE
jgi:hypothetical protein